MPPASTDSTMPKHPPAQIRDQLSLSGDASLMNRRYFPQDLSAQTGSTRLRHSSPQALAIKTPPAQDFVTQAQPPEQPALKEPPMVPSVWLPP